MKIVSKPWGKEMWIELNERYCYKRIYINKGHRTSFQYHRKKLETNYIIAKYSRLLIDLNRNPKHENLIPTYSDNIFIKKNA